MWSNLRGKPAWAHQGRSGEWDTWGGFILFGNFATLESFSAYKRRPPSCWPGLMRGQGGAQSWLLGAFVNRKVLYCVRACVLPALSTGDTPLRGDRRCHPSWSDLPVCPCGLTALGRHALLVQGWGNDPLVQY